MSDKKLPLSMAAVSLSAAFLVGGYEFARVAAATVFMHTYGSSKMPYALSAVPVAMAVLVYLYARTLSSRGPMKTMLISMGTVAVFFIAAYLALPAQGHQGVRFAPAAFYIFAEVYVVIIVEQLWSFINSTLNPSNARIYNGPITGGGALGPLLADWVVKNYAQAIGTEQLILLAAVVTIPAALLMWLAYRIMGEPRPSAAEKAGAKGYLHLSLIKENKTLFYLMCAIFLSQVVATTLNFKLYALMENVIPGKDARTAYLGGVWMYINMASAIMQFAVTPFLLRFVPYVAIMAAIPMIHLATTATLAFNPALGVAAFALGAFKSLDYSLFRAAKELIYVPLSYDARYRAKQIVDGFTYRFSKGATALSFSVWQGVAGAAASPPYAAVAACAAGLWLAVSIPLGRRAGGQLK